MTNPAQPRRRAAFRAARALLLATAVASLAACGGNWDKDDDDDDGGDPPAVTVGEVVALTATARLISFDRATPGTLRTTFPITGLQASEVLVGIDYRPADGALYAVSNQSRLYTLAPATGVATFKVTLTTTLAGTSFGVDFNPVANRLRVVSNTGQNLRIDVDNGAVTVDGTINGGASGSAITASAYTNAFAGTATTQLYALDAVTGTLYLQNPPNAGTLSAPLPIGVIGTVSNGFDIDPRDNVGYAALATSGTTALYTIPVGATAVTAVRVGTIGSGDALVGLALKPPAAPTVVALTADARLVTFDPTAPNTLTANVGIGSLVASETVLGIDIRPANGRLYALTSLGRVLTVDPATGVSTLVSTLVADPTDTTAPFAGLGGGLYSVDFNPVADRLRVLTDSGANLRINVDTGAVITDTPLSRATPPSVVAGAYTSSSVASTRGTRLYDLDAVLAVLTEQTPPNNGTLVDIGPVGVAFSGQTAFDIGGGESGLALAALRTTATGPFSLYAVSLTTGTATLYRNTSGVAGLSQIGGATGPVIVDLAIRY